MQESQARADRRAPRAATFHYDGRSDRWHWSDELFRLHGFEPQQVVPTTDLLVAHQHPDDRRTVAEALAAAAHEGGSFACLHRIRDATGLERTVLLAGDAEPGRRRVRGTVTDLSPAITAAARARASEAIQASAEHRAAIEQAKGGLALALAITPDDAFKVLRALSNESNTAIRDLARGLVAALPAADGDAARLLDLLRALTAGRGRGGAGPAADADAGT